MSEGPRGAPGRVDADHIARALRAEIVDGRLPPGTSVPEVELAQRFGVSRTPAREALSSLRHDRLLVPGPRSLQVRRIDPDEVVQVYDLRILLEGQVAEQAARRRTTGDVLELEGLIDRDRGLVDPDDRTRATTNDEFHRQLWSAAHNPVLSDVMRRLTVHLVRAPHSTLSAPGRWEQSLDEHAAVVTAVEAQDADLAGELARAHMSAARRIRLGLLRAAAAGGEPPPVAEVRVADRPGDRDGR